MRRDLICLTLVVVGASAVYVWMGRPGLPDQPFTERAAEIAQRDVRDLTPDEFLTRLQGVAQERPDLPDPHYYIGILLQGQGRDEDAIRAFQAALRRDERHVPSLIGLADTLVMRETGTLIPIAERLYAQAWQIDSGEVRAGFLAGLAAWRDGRTEEAEARWSAVESGLGEDASELAEFRNWVQGARADVPAVEEAQP